jgi:glutathione S-transferase
MAEKPTLGYWNVRGLGGICRALLRHLAVDFEDKMYVLGDESAASWASCKEGVGLNFPQLPHLIDGDVKVSEHKTVIRSIARKYAPAYLGRTLKE